MCRTTYLSPVYHVVPVDSSVIVRRDHHRSQIITTHPLLELDGKATTTQAGGQHSALIYPAARFYGLRIFGGGVHTYHIMAHPEALTTENPLARQIYLKLLWGGVLGLQRF